MRAEQPLEISVGMLPREVAGDWRTDPEEEALLADSVGLALYVVMDALTPAERVSFVFHDVFEVPFGAIATILGRSTAATKMLASRARGRVRLGTPPAPADTALIDGAPGILITVGGRPVMIVAFTVADGAITAIRTLTRPGPAGPGRPLVGHVTMGGWCSRPGRVYDLQTAVVSSPMESL